MSPAHSSFCVSRSVCIMRPTAGFRSQRQIVFYTPPIPMGRQQRAHTMPTARPPCIYILQNPPHAHECAIIRVYTNTCIESVMPHASYGRNYCIFSCSVFYERLNSSKGEKLQYYSTGIELLFLCDYILYSYICVFQGLPAGRTKMLVGCAPAKNFSEIVFFE